ncbi:peptidoglycan-binding domain-containing protein [Streptomyces sp. NPDC046977]|uniref:peptidoglycan-binding domain-containing protein n=1 Tax=Streptomyces sp. NPDC046977 TaxID=3154703 RepID=UPI0033D696EE
MGRRSQPRSRGPLLVAVAVVVAGAAVAVAVVGLHAGNRAPAPSRKLAVATAVVTRQTLTQTATAPGTLGFAHPVQVSNRLAGTYTALPAVGATVTRGQRLFAVDDRPVTLLYGLLPAYRELKPGVVGDDVLELEQNLAGLGYGDFTVDTAFSAKTEAAVRRWQKDTAQKVTGAVALGQVVFLPGPSRVSDEKVSTGDAAVAGQQVMAATDTTRTVRTQLKLADKPLAVPGSRIKVTLPDGSTVPATVAMAASGAAADGGTGAGADPGGADAGPAGEPTVQVLVALSGAGAQRAAAPFDGAGVEVTFTALVHRNVLAVPVEALVALADGGYGLQVVDGTASTYVPVTTGMFASGKVEVSGPGIRAGSRVGVPQ